MKHLGSFCLRLASCVAGAAFLLPTSAHAHQGHSHAKGEKPALAAPGPEREKRLVMINESYVARVKPIFMAKCFNCHGEDTTFPWYYKIPGVKQFIDSDISEAKEHIEMSHDFPFRGHGKPEEDLDAIVESMAKGDMPPWYYRMMHSGSKVTDAEAKAIVAWAKESRAQLFWEK